MLDIKMSNDCSLRSSDKIVFSILHTTFGNCRARELEKQIFHILSYISATLVSLKIIFFLRRRREGVSFPPCQYFYWIWDAKGISNRYYYFQVEYAKPSFIYSWSISHILEHEFFCLGSSGCKEKNILFISWQFLRFFFQLFMGKKN